MRLVTLAFLFLLIFPPAHALCTTPAIKKRKPFVQKVVFHGISCSCGVFPACCALHNGSFGVWGKKSGRFVWTEEPNREAEDACVRLIPLFWLWSRCLYRLCMCICLAGSRYPGVFVCGRICPHVNVHESVRSPLCPCTYIISVFLVMESNGFTGTLWNADEHLFGRKVSAHAPAPCLSLTISCQKHTLDAVRRPVAAVCIWRTERKNKFRPKTPVITGRDVFA